METSLFKARILVSAFAVVLLLTACAPAGHGQLQVSDVWARPSLASGNSAVYFVIENRTDSDDTLLSASSDIASAVEMHMTSMEGDNMQMMPQEEVSIETGKTVFQPGGLHVMLVGLNQDLNPGDKFLLKLNFATAGELILDVTVNEP